MSEQSSMHQRIRDRLVLLDNGLTHRDEIANHRVALEALEILFRPPEKEATDEEVDTQYQTMEQAAFAVAKAALIYIKPPNRSAIAMTEAYVALKEAVLEFENLADQYERNWE